MDSEKQARAGWLQPPQPLTDQPGISGELHTGLGRAADRLRSKQGSCPGVGPGMAGSLFLWGQPRCLLLAGPPLPESWQPTES